MRSAQWIQVLLVPLLFLFCVIGVLMTRKGEELPAGPLTIPELRDQGEQAPISPLPASDLSIPRDLFDLPALLRQRLLDRNPPIPPVEPPIGTPRPGEPEVQPPDLRVQGLFWGGSHPQAIINRHIVAEGETIPVAGAAEGVKVLAVSESGVEVSFQGREFFLSGTTTMEAR